MSGEFEKVNEYFSILIHTTDGEEVVESGISPIAQ